MAVGKACGDSVIIRCETLDSFRTLAAVELTLTPDELRQLMKSDALPLSFQGGAASQGATSEAS